MKLKYSYIAGEFGKAFTDKYLPVARAATAAITEATLDAKEMGRKSIMAAGPGFQRKWPRVLQSKVFPRPPNVSANAAGLVWLKSAYGGIFEEGGTITGSPYLWIPLKGTPKSINGQRMRPGLLRGLVTIKRPGKPPLLAVRVRVTSSRLAQKVTVSQILRGTSGKRGTIRAIPLFVGVPKVTIGKKFSIVAACEKAAAKLPGLYYRNLKDD